MNTTGRRAFGALAFFFLAAQSAGAAGLPPAEATTAQVRVRLLAAADAVHPGGRVLLGVEQQLQPHWHTYWINPGDTGVPTRIAWTLPEGAQAGPIQWPVPARFRTGPVTSYGYEDRVTLLANVTVPADAKPGTAFPIHAQVSWLVCKDVCIPQHAELGLTLPVQAIGVPSGPGLLAAEQAKSLLPVDAPGADRAPVDAVTDGKGIALTLGGPAFHGEGLEDIRFFAEPRGSVNPGAAQAPDIADGRIVLRLRAGDAPLAAGQRLTGVLALRTRAAGDGAHAVATRGYRIDVPLSASAAPIALPPLDTASASGAGTAGAAAADGSLPTLLPALAFALLGGLVLNLMPCVFPVLSIKALSLLHHAQEDPRTARLHGVAYTLGVLASFALLGVALIALKAAGGQAGWGFQFQSPAFVLATSWLMFAVGLNLSGLFEVNAAVSSSLAGIGSSLAARSGYAGSFFTGVLATVVATPCTAPFMGGAVAFALAQPPAVLLAVFLSMGLGLALPYLALSAWPVLQRRLPRPGAWMEWVRQALAFPMYGAAAWLAWVLVRQAGVDAVPVALGGMVAIAFAAWLFGSTRFARPAPRRAGGAIAAAVLAATIGAGAVGIKLRPASAPTSAPSAAGADAGEGWTPYSAERLDALRADGKPVFVNLTAAWCITCLVNERVALSDAAVNKAFREAGVHTLKGDWTNQDERISALLAQFGRSGVPLYVFYPAGRAARPTVLPQLLSPETVLSAIRTPIVQARQ